MVTIDGGRVSLSRDHCSPWTGVLSRLSVQADPERSSISRRVSGSCQGRCPLPSQGQVQGVVDRQKGVNINTSKIKTSFPTYKNEFSNIQKVLIDFRLATLQEFQLSGYLTLPLSQRLLVYCFFVVVVIVNGIPSIYRTSVSTKKERFLVSRREKRPQREREERYKN